MLLDAPTYKPTVPEAIPLPDFSKQKEFFRKLILDRLRRKEKNRKLEKQIKNQSQPDAYVPLQPLQQVILQKNLPGSIPMSVDLTDNYRSEFNYLYHTQGAEFNTERTAFLEEYVGRMLLGESYTGPYRVVILNQTKELKAFVCADGSIIISQALISLLETVDEVVAVLAHELGHLIHKTIQTSFEKTNKAFGVGWVHEFIATDAETVRLLEKVGLNSHALADSFLKLQDVTNNARGQFHQSSLTRASNIKLEGKFIPSTTSATEKQLLPEKMIGQHEPSNMELADEIRQCGDSKLIGVYIDRLHPKDREKFLNTSYKQNADKHIINGVDHFLDLRIPESERKIVGIIFKLHYSLGDHYFQNYSLEEFFALLETLPTFLAEGKATRIFIEFFGEEYQENTRYLSFILRNLLGVINHSIFFYAKKGVGTMLNRETLITYLKLLKQARKKMDEGNLDSSHVFFRDNDHITSTVESFIENYYLAQPPINLEDLRDFCIQMNSMRIQLWLGQNDYNRFIHDYPSDELEAAISIIEEVFKIQIKRPITKESPAFNSLEDFKRQMKDFFATSDFEAFLFHFRNSLQELVYKPSTLTDVNSAKEDSLIRVEIGKELIPWINTLDLSKVALNSYKEDVKRMQLLSEICSCCFSKEIEDDELISFVEKMLAGVRSEKSTLTYDQIYNLIAVLDIPNSIRRGDKRVTVDTDKRYNLSLFRLLREKAPKFEAASFQELVDEYESRTTLLRYEVHQLDNNIFSYWLFGDLESNVMRLISTMSLENIPDLLILFKKLPHELQTQDLRKKLLKKFISKECVATLEEKTDFMVEFHKEFGYEDLIVLCSQVSTFDQFLTVSRKISAILQSWVTGEVDATDIAAVDNGVSLLGDPIEVLRTIDETLDESSQKGAEAWFERLRMKHFIPPATIITSDFGKSESTLREIFYVLQNLDIFKKILIVTRLLNDVGSPLTHSKESRTELMRLLIKVFNFKNPFLKLALQGVIENGRKDYVSLQIAQLMGPLIFRNLSVQRVNIEKLKKYFGKIEKEREENIPFVPYIKDIMGKNSSELYQFGLDGRDLAESYSSDSLIASEAIRGQQSAYLHIDQAIRERFNLDPFSEFDETTDKTPEKISTNEAIIQGMERGGALFVRCLQIASQLFSFDRKTADRLANTLDQAEKMDQFRFWQALKIYSEKYPHFGEWVKSNFVRLEGVIGGGSLYTTYGIVVNENGQEVQAVLKLLKPNSAAELKDARQVSLAALEEVLSQGNKKDKERAKLAIRIVEMAYAWCKDDINDTEYAGNDAFFADTIRAFNQQHSEVEIRQSQTYFVDSFATCESRFEGRTLNSVLRDPKIPSEQKQRIFSAYRQFYEYQSQRQSLDLSLSHSDPHVGNYQVISDGEHIVLGMMDRRLYLVDEEKDRQILRHLADENYPQFLDTFVARICEYNQVPELHVALVRKIKRELLQQRVRTVFDRSESFIGDLNIILSVLEKNEVPVPYQWQLRIRNQFMLSKTEESLLNQ